MNILERSLQTIVITLAALLLAAIGLRPLYISHDVSMYLEIGRRLLEGQLPYVDFYEINFPVIHYLHTIPAQISLWTGINIIIVMLLSVWLLTIWSIWISLRISRPFFTGNLRAAAYLYPIGLLFYSHWWFVEATFGQREHLFILLFMPAFFLRLIHWLSESPSDTPFGDFILGFIAGIAVSIKPHFLLIPIITELYGFIFVHRSVRRLLHLEVLGLLTFGVLHILYFLALPQVFSGLMETIALVQVGYNAYGGERTFLDLARMNSTLRATVVLIFMLVIHWRLRTHLAILEKALCIMGLAAVSIYFVQGRGFLYHQQIFDVMEFAVFSILIFEIVVSMHRRSEAPFPVLSRLKARTVRLATLFLTILIPILIIVVNTPTLIGWYIITTIPEWYISKSEVTDIIEAYSQPDEGILVINSDFYSAFPRLQRINRRQSASHLVAYPYVMALAGNKPDAMASWVAIVAQDIQQQQPNVILIFPEINTYLRESGFFESYIDPYYTQVYANDVDVIYVKREIVN